MCESLRARGPQAIDAPVTKETLKFGSFNVNGLDIEARWAVEQLLDTRGFDVSRDYHTNYDTQLIKSCLYQLLTFTKCTNISNIRCWLYLKLSEDLISLP